MISSQTNKKMTLCLVSLFSSLWWHIHDDNTNVCQRRLLLMLLLLSASADSRTRDFYPCSHTQRLPLGTKLYAFQESQEERMPSGKTIKFSINNNMFDSTSSLKKLHYITCVFLSGFFWVFLMKVDENTK